MTSFGDEIHVVSFDIPYPADYGGVIDIFYKIKALHKEGIGVILHCYQYGRTESPELEKYCKEVHYYRRKVFKNPFLGKKPYIVASRNSTGLIENLLKTDAPILFEGLHSTYYLDDPRLKDRVKIVRTHNVEHDYYRNLELVESNYFKKYFFRVEGDKLEKYEEILRHATYIAAISPKDTGYFESKYGNTQFVPPFHGNSRIYCKPGKGDFALYHGNLAVGENIEAAKFLISEVFSQLDFPLLIAGNNPPSDLVSEVENHRNVTLKSGVSTQGISKMMEEAHINVLHTSQDTGIKLKLINALFRGRFCVANDEMINETGVEDLCVKANTPKEFISVIKNLVKKPFTEEDIENRKKGLKAKFDNRHSARMIISLFKGEEIQNDKKEPAGVLQEEK